MPNDHALEAALMQAVTMHDLPTLMELVDDEQTMRLLQSSVLPWADVPEVLWFWRSIQDSAFDGLCHTIREACSGILLKKGFEPGTDFSWGFDPQAEVPTLHIGATAHAALIGYLPPERYSTARIILREDS